MWIEFFMVYFPSISKFDAAKWIVLALALAGLGSCTKFPNQHARPTPLSGNSQSPYTMPAQAYLALAKNQTEGEQQNILLLAAGRFIDDGQFQEAERILAHIAHLSELQLDEKN